MKRRRFWLIIKATVASLYFALMFFLVFPGVILYFTRADPLSTGGYGIAIPGAAIILCANVLVAKLVGDFIRRGDGTQVPIDPPRRIVQSSLYARTRNPMYLAYIAVVLGEAMLFGSAALVIYAVVLWGIAHIYVVLREEPLLQKRFGDEYRRYLERVPRWGWATSVRSKTNGR